MVAQALSEDEWRQHVCETLARHESQLQRIFTALRSIRTALEALQSPTPPSLSTASATPPQVATEPSPNTKPSPEPFTPSSKQTYLTNPSDPTPLRPNPMNIHHQKSDSHLIETQYAKQKPNMSMFLMPSTHTPRFFEKDHLMPKQTKILPSSPSYGIEMGPPQPCHYKDHFHLKNEVQIAYFAGKREWRPPWRLVIIYPDSMGRTEWRNPWHFVMTRPNDVKRTEWRTPWLVTEHLPIASLRTRIVQAGGIVTCNPCNRHMHAHVQHVLVSFYFYKSYIMESK
ncbi:hypothetical protein HanXRQr2_Chr16g0777341 [Helianthus annuus]|uniref:Uncharacterized protein n=1 Tax=Helianthus annuus TaxID=4232 RepID=A0A9K3DW41_HELAN|nr:hypothetical protein HanXRQr2_Chr16g0777341 [Helianthus annuus]KAJ0440208.1 hypothetical protein HanHA300_Chr16g0633881 [Helianthus annuus]KAJ0642988.1 hypothetical protein HanLR1_Chr16g0644441 [Helianthus annuus]KAJ0646855.1 hypothetical protein HanOQP8_Chr16g0639781 [Helianthus annuus]